MAAGDHRRRLSALRVARQAPPQPSIRGNWHDLTPREAFDRVDQERGAETAAGAAGPMVRPIGAGRDAAPWPPRRADARRADRSLRKSAQLVGAVAEELRDPLTPVLALGAAASAIVGSGVDALLVGSVWPETR